MFVLCLLIFFISGFRNPGPHTVTVISEALSSSGGKGVCILYFGKKYGYLCKNKYQGKNKEYSDSDSEAQVLKKYSSKTQLPVGSTEVE